MIIIIINSFLVFLFLHKLCLQLRLPIHSPPSLSKNKGNLIFSETEKNTSFIYTYPLHLPHSSEAHPKLRRRSLLAVRRSFGGTSGEERRKVRHK